MRFEVFRTKLQNLLKIDSPFFKHIEHLSHYLRCVGERELVSLKLKSEQ